jgi:PPOX class probable F420-dependent enzyme
MEIAEALEFIRSNHRGVLATLRRDGSPQLTPITVSVDADGMAVVSSRETAAKVKNLRRDPRAWLTVMNDGFFGEFVKIEGAVRIVALPEAMDGVIVCFRAV